MKAATWPRAEPLEERLLHVDPASGELHDARVADLPRLLAPGDVLVVNDAATLPVVSRSSCACSRGSRATTNGARCCSVPVISTRRPSIDRRRRRCCRVRASRSARTPHCTRP
jgi:hypothetical protein